MWLRREWADLLDELLLGPHVEQRGWFRREALQQLVAEHRNAVDHAYLLWALMVLELWLRVVEGQPVLQNATRETPQPAFSR
jgi:hypothetical protein